MSQNRQDAKTPARVDYAVNRAPGQIKGSWLNLLGKAQDGKRSSVTVGYRQ